MRRIGQIYVQYPRMMSTYAKYLTTVEHYGSEEDNMWDLAGVFYMPEMSTLMDDEVHKKLLYALKETVVYCVRGPGRSTARGLSFCYAVDFDKAELDEYARNCPCPHYLAFLDAISPWTAPDWVYETAERLPEAEALEEYRVVAKKTILEDGTPALSFDADCYLGASSVRYNIFGRSKDTNEIISLGILPAMYDASNGENGTFSAMKLWKWPSLQGEYVTSFVIGQVSPGAREYLGSIPIRIGADKWFLRYGYFYDDDRYVVYGLWDGYESSNGLFNRNVKSLAQLAGQEYCLLYPVFISDYEVPTEFYTGQPQNIYRSLSMESQTIPPSTYYIQYVVYDMFMRPMPMELIEINWDGEKLTLADGVSWEGEETLQVDPDYWE